MIVVKRVLKNNWVRCILYAGTALFMLMNIIAFFHAWKFTHFSDTDVAPSKDPSSLDLGEKLSILFTGASLPRPRQNKIPRISVDTIYIQSNKKIAAWWMKQEHALGTVVLFHGYGGEKSSMLDKAAFFYEQKYNCLLVDFMGSGGSEGNQTTIGFYEAEQVKDCCAFLNREGERGVILYGTSMGAVAIMKALHDFNCEVSGVILECPFGTMYETVCARFNSMQVPTFPMAGLLVFWGGVQNGFWAFDHNPERYASKVHCPVLLMSGGKDEKVSLFEIDRIFNNLAGPKNKKIFPNAGHENYWKKYKAEWKAEVKTFTNQLN